jgi:hypothetical protein
MFTKLGLSSVPIFTFMFSMDLHTHKIKLFSFYCTFSLCFWYFHISWIFVLLLVFFNNIIAVQNFLTVVKDLCMLHTCTSSIESYYVKILSLIAYKVESIKGASSSKLKVTLKFRVNSSQSVVSLSTSSSKYQFFGCNTLVSPSL